MLCPPMGLLTKRDTVIGYTHLLQTLLVGSIYACAAGTVLLLRTQHICRRCQVLY